jgi:hypothetical protein
VRDKKTGEVIYKEKWQWKEWVLYVNS